MPAYSPAHPSSNGLGPLPNVVAAIGHTPLIKLRKASELTGCTILAKAEFANPGGSIKDRTAKFIIEDAEAKDVEPGVIKPFRDAGLRDAKD